MSEANKMLVRRWFEEVWNDGREATIDELLAPEGVARGLGDGEVDLHGPAGFKTFWRNMREAIPDVRIDLDGEVAEGDDVVVRVVLHGTHSGHGLGVAPTGRKIRAAGIIQVRFQGKQVVECWNSWDQLGLLRQIGVIPAADRDRFVHAK